MKGSGRGGEGGEKRERKTTRGRRTGRGDDDYNDHEKYTPPHPELDSAVISSNLNMDILFVFGGKEDVETASGYTKITFALFIRGYILVFFRWCRYQLRGQRDSSWELQNVGMERVPNVQIYPHNKNVFSKWIIK